MSELRQVLLACFIGHTGTGKTSTCVELTKHWRRTHRGAKVIGFDPHEMFSREKLLDNFISPSDEYWAERLMQRDKTGRYKFQDSLLILDDYRSLLTGSHTPRTVLDLLMLRRKIRMDIFYVTHNPKLILEKFSYYTNMYGIFYTESTASDFSDKIPHYAACQKASNAINKYVREYGRGTYPDFPHVLVTTESDELNFVNVDMQKLNRLYI